MSLEEIRGRVQKATEGPWEVRQVNEYTGAWIAAENNPHGFKNVVSVVARDMDRLDAEFVAHARTDVEFLLDLVDELKADDNSYQSGIGNYGDAMYDVDGMIRERIKEINDG